MKRALTFCATRIAHPASALFTTRQMAASQVINAPSHEASRGLKSVFLAGSTSSGQNWRYELTSSLSTFPITFFNPDRPDWDSSWREDINFEPWNEQVSWELEKQSTADVVVVFFHPDTKAPISLLEFGLSSREPAKVIAVCPEGYWKRANVQLVSQKLGIEFLDNFDQLKGSILKKLAMDV
ncbi:hypothetical protein CC79DRAFT_1327154 [Sarocladium strictum]